MLKQKYFLTGIFILSAERQPIKLAWRKIVWLRLFHPDFGEFDYMYMVVILLLISWIAWLIGKVLNLLISNKERKEKNTKINNIVDFLYLKFRQDIDMTYAVFFAIYLVFYRHEKAIAYLILLLFGLYLGKKIAIRANRYIVDQANKKNTP